ncbi:amidase family protein [Kitasatospora sp. NPDC098652]|uniref:amidase family protein n=1 Tax=Kitasatospora sp. NPDC098652 TaxID=3364095 RepID=UPI0038004934
MAEPHTTSGRGRGPGRAHDLVSAALDRAAAVAHLNAFITLDAERALAQAARSDARRSVRGGGGPAPWSLVVKDNTHVAGLPNTAGTPALADFVPAADAPVVAALRSAGAIVLGKTNMHELSLGATSCNHTFGAVGNATDPALFAGGSSGGTAVAVAAGVAEGWLGTDTGGSVTIPAALNGVYGLRPSAGRYSSAGVTPLSTTRDTPGLMARTLDRLTALDALVTGSREATAARRTTGAASTADTPAAPARPLRLGLPRQVFAEDLEAPVRTAWEQALDRLTAARTTWVPVDTAHLVEYDARIGFPLVFGEFATALGRYLMEHGAGVGPAELIAAVGDPDLAALLGATALPGSPGYPGEAGLRSALATRRTLQEAYAQLFTAHGLDALLSPTVPVCARPLRRYEDSLPLNGRDAPTFHTLIRNTSPAATAGLPSVTIPLPVTGSAPVGVQLIGRRLADRELLATAARVDAVLRCP